MWLMSSLSVYCLDASLVLARSRFSMESCLSELFIASLMADGLGYSSLIGDYPFCPSV